MNTRESKEGSISSSSSRSCEDCGNKAKRDCEHRRCRTCCITRGLHCPTHVNSTWVPVSSRRHRQQQRHQLHHQQLLLPVDYHHYPPRPLSLSTSTSILHHRHSPPSGLGGLNFPAELNSLATFRCIRVNSEDNIVNQFAYQTSINIGGHVFKGILYDQGPTTTSSGGQSSSATTNDNQHHQRHHQFNISATTNTTTSGGGANLLYSPPSLYSTPLNAFLPGEDKTLRQ